MIRNDKSLKGVIVLWLILPLAACSNLLTSRPVLNVSSNGTPSDTGDTEIPRATAPELLNFEDLVQLSAIAEPEGELRRKLESLLNFPFVDNGPFYTGVEARRPHHTLLGPVLRACQWNIERGINFDWILLALSNADEFLKRISIESGAGKNEIPIIAEQLKAIGEIDLLILNEVDYGVTRTNYRNVAKEIAGALQMNYAFGVDFIEVDKLNLGLETIAVEDPEVAREFQKQFDVDPSLYKGLHGTAVLSRYPISNVRIKRLTKCYDWYNEEKESISKLEKGKRVMAKTIFLERISRELRHGSRIALIADLTVPELPDGRATVVATHLESKCSPKERRLQMEEILTWIRDIGNPVILAGDLNTSGGTGSPTSANREVRKRLKSRTFWTKQVINYLNPLGWFRLFELPGRYFKNYQDPTVVHVPLFAPNHEAGLFKSLKEFRFTDGFAFDFRGQKERTTKDREKTLANSNKRTQKGFKPTFEFERDYGGIMGEYKLDWFLIKAFLSDPDDERGSYHFAPHFPMTMEELDEAPPERISDHFPITVDLPLNEPSL